MRRLPVLWLMICFLSPLAFLYAETGKKMEKAPLTKSVSPAVRVTRMRAAGVVTEISDTILKIERKVKDQAETMEFILESPVPSIKAGDKVRVSYITKNDKNIAQKVTEDIPLNGIKKTSKKVEGKPVPPGAAPVRK